MSDNMSDNKEDSIEKKVKQPRKSKQLINLTDYKFEVEGYILDPNSSIELTKELKDSNRVKHGVNIGIFKIA